MLRNYFKIAWRNLAKNKIYSVINIAGLAIGLSSFLLIALYVLDEINYDRFIDKSDRIYRINADIRVGGGDLHLPFTSDMMGELLKKDYPEVEEYTRVYASSGSKLVKKGNEYIEEPDVAHADSTFFKVFNFPVILGNPQTALNEPNTVVVSESAARKYFGTSDVVGKTIETDDNTKTDYEITAVMKDMPENSHFRFDFIFSMKNVRYPWGRITSHNFFTYLLFKQKPDIKAFDQKFKEYTNKYVLPEARQFMNVSSMEEFEKAGNKLVYTLIPLTKIHLYSDRSFELRPSGNIQYVFIFSAVALFILVIACINFMNLTTARSANRAREVGIRKVLGTERRQLVVQFLFESVVMVLCSLILALCLDYFVLPAFNELSGKNMHLSNLFSPAIIPLLVALPVLVGLLAGSYPAFFLSGFKPIEVLKGKLKLGSKSGSLRSVLVVFQFATSIVLIIGTIVVFKQLNYIQNKKLGFNKDQVLIINGTGSLGNNVDAFKNEVLQMPGVRSGTVSGFLPVSNSSRNDQTYSKEAVMDSKTGIDMQTWTVDYDYIKTMGMEIVKGRNFSREFGADSTTVIINETTARFLGYANPVGQKIYTFTQDLGTLVPFEIIGVVKNFHFESLRKDIGPLCFHLGRNPYITSFKVTAGNINTLIPRIESKWKSMALGMPFSYRFLDDSFNEMYTDEHRVGKLAMIFSCLAILIACLGLFGLATFIAEQRTKEIGIRKVLGASVSGMINLLSKDFLRLVVISFLIAAPLAWWFMHKWLQDFVYRISISWWVFVLSGCIALFIAMATVSFQAVKAAVANPVKSLRTE